MRVEIKTVTPKFALSLLDKNTSNRKINTNQLDMLVRTMQSGNWRLTHQGVAVYDDGTLADGQHRLKAVIKSGVSCKMPIFYGVSKDDQSVMAIDCGKQRSVVDGMNISGDKVSANAITLAKGLYFGYEFGMKKLSHQEISDLCVKYEDQINIAKSILSTNKSGVSIAPVKVAILNAITDGADKNLAGEFYKTLISGEYTKEIMKNAVRLRNKLLSNNYNGGHERQVAYRMTYNTIMSTQENKNVKRIISN